MYREIRYKKHARPARKAWKVVLVFGVLSLALFACGRPATSSQPTPAGATATVATPPAVQPTFTPAPTPTPQPRAVLLASEASDPQQTAALQELLARLAGEANLDFQALPALAPGDLTAGLRAVVALPPDPGLAALAAAAPQTQFLAIDIPDLPASANLSLVDTQAVRPDQQGFLAGYLASVVTPDWRVGVISTNDDPTGKSQRQGFVNGVIFYCGLCRPAYPPFVQYPVIAELASGANPADQQAAAEALLAQGVTTIYVAPGAGDASLLEYLAQKGINIIGSVPPPADLKDHWVATISGDRLEAVRQAWDGIINQQPAGDQNMPLAISDRNEALFSSGRLRIVEQVRDELANDLIDTGVNPSTGESK